MARYDKDGDITLPTSNPQKNIDKRKGEMSIREAASLEMQTVHTETGMRGMPVHGFGDGMADTPKRHTPSTDMTLTAPPMSTGDSVTGMLDQLFQLPFHAQLGMLRMIAPRILGAMDARDRESFMNALRAEIDTMDVEAHGHTASTDPHDIQGT
jgi:hypothetical protein